MLSLAWSVWSGGRGPGTAYERQRDWITATSARTRWTALGLAVGAMIAPDFGLSLL
jgi:hypothetical protein